MDDYSGYTAEYETYALGQITFRELASRMGLRIDEPLFSRLWRYLVFASKQPNGRH